MTTLIDRLHSKRKEHLNCFYSLPIIPDHVVAQVIYDTSQFAHARVLFSRRDNLTQYVSTYLDTCDALGIMGEPYFEIYPNEEGECTRYLYNEQDQMYEHVFRLLAEKKETNK